LSKKRSERSESKKHSALLTGGDQMGRVESPQVIAELLQSLMRTVDELELYRACLSLQKGKVVAGSIDYQRG